MTGVGMTIWTVAEMSRWHVTGIVVVLMVVGMPITMEVFVITVFVVAVLMVTMGVVPILVVIPVGMVARGG